MGIKYDGMPSPKEQQLPEEIDEDKLIGYIMRNTSNHGLNYAQVKSVLDAEEQYMIDNGYMDSN